MEVVRFLEAAAATATEIDIIYAGGSRPGAARRVLPTSLNGTILKAQCNGAPKSFKVSLIQLPEAIRLQDFRTYTSIQDLLLLEQKTISASGLIPEADRFHLTLYQENKRPVLSIRRKEGHWWVRDQRYASFQPAAEAFILALRMRSMNRK